MYREFFLKGSPSRYKPVLTRSAAIRKAAHYCAYQERAHQELRDKLYDLGLYRNEVEQVIAEMILSGFLNEERFAMAYVSGKFRINHWGRRKIRHGLRLKRVPDKLIEKALATIDPGDYRDTILRQAEKYSRQLTERHPQRRKWKVAHYLAERGFEPELVSELLEC